MLCVMDDGSGASSFRNDVSSRYNSWIGSCDQKALLASYLTYTGGSYKPSVLVTSCPGDV